MTVTSQETPYFGTHRLIPRNCSCTWQWITSSGPWRWQLTHVSPSCTVHNPPADSDAAAIVGGTPLPVQRKGGGA